MHRCLSLIISNNPYYSSRGRRPGVGQSASCFLVLVSAGQRRAGDSNDSCVTFDSWRKTNDNDNALSWNHSRQTQTARNYTMLHRRRLNLCQYWYVRTFKQLSNKISRGARHWYIEWIALFGGTFYVCSTAPQEETPPTKKESGYSSLRKIPIQ